MNYTPPCPWRKFWREKVTGRQALESDITSSEITGMVFQLDSLRP